MPFDEQSLNFRLFSSLFDYSFYHIEFIFMLILNSMVHCNCNLMYQRGTIVRQYFERILHCNLNPLNQYYLYTLSFCINTLFLDGDLSEFQIKDRVLGRFLCHWRDVMTTVNRNQMIENGIICSKLFSYDIEYVILLLNYAQYVRIFENVIYYLDRHRKYHSSRLGLSRYCHVQFI